MVVPSPRSGGATGPSWEEASSLVQELWRTRAQAPSMLSCESSPSSKGCRPVPPPPPRPNPPTAQPLLPGTEGLSAVAATSITFSGGAVFLNF